MILDLTKAELPNWWPEWMPKTLPVKPGEFEKKYDVDFQKIDPVLTVKIYNFWGELFGPNYSQRKPIGFDSLPKGAVLR